MSIYVYIDMNIYYIYLYFYKCVYMLYFYIHVVIANGQKSSQKGPVSTPPRNGRVARAGLAGWVRARDGTLSGAAVGARAEGLHPPPRAVGQGVKAGGWF